jgi:hypothetical protein
MSATRVMRLQSAIGRRRKPPLPDRRPGSQQPPDGSRPTIAARSDRGPLSGLEGRRRVGSDGRPPIACVLPESGAANRRAARPSPVRPSAALLMRAQAADEATYVERLTPAHSLGASPPLMCRCRQRQRSSALMSARILDRGGLPAIRGIGLTSSRSPIAWLARPSA